jgi:hypothetical protein
MTLLQRWETYVLICTILAVDHLNVDGQPSQHWDHFLNLEVILRVFCQEHLLPCGSWKRFVMPSVVYVGS